MGIGIRERYNQLKTRGQGQLKDKRREVCQRTLEDCSVFLWYRAYLTLAQDRATTIVLVTMECGGHANHMRDDGRNLVWDLEDLERDHESGLAWNLESNPGRESMGRAAVALDCWEFQYDSTGMGVAHGPTVGIGHTDRYPFEEVQQMLLVASNHWTDSSAEGHIHETAAQVVATVAVVDIGDSHLSRKDARIEAPLPCNRTQRSVDVLQGNLDSSTSR